MDEIMAAAFFDELQKIAFQAPQIQQPQKPKMSFGKKLLIGGGAAAGAGVAVGGLGGLAKGLGFMAKRRLAGK